MQKRHAIIILSANVKGLTFLPGVEEDGRNWLDFLQSPAGGAWQREEICVLHTPLMCDVKEALTNNSDAYYLVVFSGHGCELFNPWSGENSQTVCLNDRERQVCLSALLPKRSYGTLIADTCRGHEVMRKKASVADESFSLFLSDVQYAEKYRRHRETWFSALDQCTAKEKRWLTMYSCSSGQSAGENPAAGGLYTSLIIKSAKNWYNVASVHSYCTTYDVHRIAYQYFQQFYPQQTPQYCSSPIEYPFAVKA